MAKADDCYCFLSLMV